MVRIEWTTHIVGKVEHIHIQANGLECISLQFIFRHNVNNILYFATDYQMNRNDDTMIYN